MNSKFFSNSETNTITIFNKKSDETYQRTVITNVYIRKVRKSIIGSKGEEVASNATIIIPTKYAKIKDDLAIESYVDSKNLDRKKAILNFTLNASLIDSPWTLISGDYIVDKECNKDFDIRELKEEYKVYRIESVADNRKGNLKHFKLEVME